MQPVLSIRDLDVSYLRDGKRNKVVRGFRLDVVPGQVVGLVGESGSGKTTVALHIMGFRPRGSKVDCGQVIFDGRDILAMTPAELTRLRGCAVAYVPQNPGAALNPTRTVGSLMSEFIRQHQPQTSAQAARARAIALMQRVGLPDVEAMYNRYPHQLSGGQQQRIVIAMAISCKPKVIVLDEPTTGLDSSTQKGIMALLRAIRDEDRVAMLYVTHDLPLLREIATNVVVMKSGEQVEAGTLEAVFADPKADYTRHLLSCIPEARRDPVDVTDMAAAPVAAKGILAAFRQVTVEYQTTSRIGLRASAAKKALDEITFDLRQGEIYALVGESGSGKSTLARSLIGLVSPTSGQIELRGKTLSGDLRRRRREDLREIGFVFQNPDLSLNPRRKIGAILRDALASFETCPRAEARNRVAQVLIDVALPVSFAERYPSELSGGQRQRVAIARALISRPELLVCDEVLTALDVSVQAEIMDLLIRLRREHDLAILFISHDLAVVRAFSDTVTVMKDGRVIVTGPTDKIFTAPCHPYVAELLAAAPGATAGEKAA